MSARLRISGRKITEQIPSAEEWYYKNSPGLRLKFLPDPQITYVPPGEDWPLQQIQYIEFEVWHGPDGFNWRIVTPNVEVYW